ncbi:MAG: bifunctional oligoribonuclease/PAP phosphatase NrnA [Turicibacter sp.]|nr:bifunctional oligoribonuclease/PAP phosphatase NrnA [Turicibacter sp.]
MTIQKDIVKKIAEFNTIIIHRHVIPDGDAYGSSFGLAEIIRATFKDKNVYVVGEELDYLNYVGTTDKIDDSMYEGALVIITDTPNATRISDERWKLGAYKIKIDHHPFTDEFADIEWIDTTYSSTCEMIVHLLMQENLKINDNGARCLFNGIVSDTGRFLFRGVSPQTLQYASELLKYEFDMVDLYAQMYTQSKSMVRFKGYILLNFEETSNGVAYVKLTDELLQELNIDETSASSQVNTLANIEGIKIWAFFVEDKANGDIRVNLRSSGATVNEIAKNYGGGGHIQAAGARVTTWDMIDQMIEDLDKLAQNH